MTAEGIDFTGPRFEGVVPGTRSRFYRPQMLNLNKYALVAQKLGPDGAAPCDGYGICILTAGGRTEFIPKSAFKDGKVVIGPKSPLKVLQNLTPAQR